MTELAKRYRPREKIVRRSVAELSDNELIQGLLGSGGIGRPVNKLARRILLLLRTEPMITYHNLTSIAGIGAAKATVILSAIEFARRWNSNEFLTNLSRNVIAKSMLNISYRNRWRIVATDKMSLNDLNPVDLAIQEVLRRALISASSVVEIDNRLDKNGSGGLSVESFLRRLEIALSFCGISFRLIQESTDG